MTQITERERAHLQLEHALAYLQQGWHLVMMAEGTKGPTHSGWNTASELIDTPEKAVTRLSNGPQNMGLVHQPSGTCSIDVDDEAWTRYIWDTFGIDYDDIMGRGMRIRSKANRDKVIFAAPDLPLQKINWPKPGATKATEVMTLFELRSGPNQDVLPPSLHPDGHNYTWWEGTAPWERTELPRIPENLLQFWVAIADRNTGLREEILNLCEWKAKPVGRTFTQRARPSSGNHNDVIGKFNAANDCGDLLEQAGYKRKGRRYLAPSSSTVIPGVVVLEDKVYSHHGSDLLADGYAHDAFDLLVTLQHGGDVQAALRDAASQLGIDRAQAPEPVEDQADISAMLAAQAARKINGGARSRASESSRRHPVNGDTVAPPPTPVAPALLGTIVVPPPSGDMVYPAHLMKPSGMAGQIVEWMLQTARSPQPMLAVAAAISLMSVVLGRKVATPSNARTNNYLVGLAETGFGKEHARDCIKLALEEAGLSQLLGGEDFASGQGMLSAVADTPVCLFLVDEFGATMEAANNKNASSHERAIIDTMIKLFSSSKSIMRGKEYANKKLNARVDIPFPNACLYTTTAPKRFYDNLGVSSISSGFMNRLLIVECPSLPPVIQRNSSLWGCPAPIAEWLKAAHAISPGIEDSGRFPVVVPYAPMAETLFMQFEESLRDRGIEMRADPSRAALADIWARAAEHAMKIALVMACGRVVDPTTLAAAGQSKCLEIDMSSAQWGIDFVKTVLGHMEHAASTRMGESDLDRVCNDATRAVSRAAERGCTTSDLNVGVRSFRALEPRLQDTVVEMLKRRGAIVQGQRQASKLSGHKAVAVWLLPQYMASSPDVPDAS